MISQAAPVSTPKAPLAGRKEGGDRPEHRSTGQDLRRPSGSGRNQHACWRQRNCGTARTERSRQDNQLLHDCWSGQAKQRSRDFLRTPMSPIIPMYKRARLGMGYLPQEESIFRKMTVEQNILAILETLPLSKAERRNRCDQLLHQFGIERIAKNTALTLSGGEKRRLTIARSLVTQPKMLMLDEPFSGVDPIAVYEIQQIIVNLRKSGLAIMITDHNVRETLSIVDRAYLIFDGRVESEGTKDFLIDDPISRQLYLGERFKM